MVINRAMDVGDAMPMGVGVMSIDLLLIVDTYERQPKLGVVEGG